MLNLLAHRAMKNIKLILDILVIPVKIRFYYGHT
jgi:hypothetical protein